MGMFDFLKPAPVQPRITDDAEMRKKYKYWRSRSMYAIIIGFVGYGFIRKSLAVAMPAIEHEFNIPKSHLGFILTAIGLASGVSMFVNGFVADRTNPRVFMTFGLLALVVINVFFGLSSGIIAFIVLWLLNSWFQGMGRASSYRILVTWFSPRERWWKFTIFGIATSIGASFGMFLNGFLIARFGWRSCFVSSAIICSVVALFVWKRLRDRPVSIGLPPVEEYCGEEPDIGDIQEAQGNAPSYREDVVKYIFLNPTIWILSWANFFVYSVRGTVSNWGTSFLTEQKGIDLVGAAGVVGGYELAGGIGMLVSVALLSKVFKGYGGRLFAISMAFCTLFIFLFWKLTGGSVWTYGLLLCGVGFMAGPLGLIAVLAANMVPKRVAVASIGFTGLLGYVSTFLSEWGMGAIVSKYGWDAGILTLVISSLITTLLFILVWNSDPHKRNVEA